MVTDGIGREMTEGKTIMSKPDEQPMSTPSERTIGEVLYYLCQEGHANSVQRGFWELPAHERNKGEMIALMHSELSEALEELRKPVSDPTETHDRDIAVTYELADVLIRIFDFCGAFELDLAGCLLYKMKYNTTREYKHGKEF